MDIDSMKDQISKAFEREEEEKLKKAMKFISSARQVDKRCCMFHNGKWYYIDRNFNPPKIEEIEE